MARGDFVRITKGSFEGMTGVIDDVGTAAQDSNTPAGQDPETDEDVTVASPADLSLTKNVNDTTPDVGL